MAAGVQVPEGFAGGGIESEQVAGIVGAEEEVAGSGGGAGNGISTNNLGGAGGGAFELTVNGALTLGGTFVLAFLFGLKDPTE